MSLDYEQRRWLREEINLRRRERIGQADNPNFLRALNAPKCDGCGVSLGGHTAGCEACRVRKMTHICVDCGQPCGKQAQRCMACFKKTKRGQLERRRVA